MEFPKLIKKGDNYAYVDSACPIGAEGLPADVEIIACQKGYRNHPLTDLQKLANKIKSSVRSRVEHVFGFMENAMHGITVRSV